MWRSARMWCATTQLYLFLRPFGVAGIAREYVCLRTEIWPLAAAVWHWRFFGQVSAPRYAHFNSISIVIVAFILAAACHCCCCCASVGHALELSDCAKRDIMTVGSLHCGTFMPLRDSFFSAHAATSFILLLRIGNRVASLPFLTENHQNIQAFVLFDVENIFNWLQNPTDGAHTRRQISSHETLTCHMHSK